MNHQCLNYSRLTVYMTGLKQYNLYYSRVSCILNYIAPIK